MKCVDLDTIIETLIKYDAEYAGDRRDASLTEADYMQVTATYLHNELKKMSRDGPGDNIVQPLDMVILSTILHNIAVICKERSFSFNELAELAILTAKLGYTHLDLE